jgi:hypothetical protein
MADKLDDSRSATLHSSKAPSMDEKAEKGSLDQTIESVEEGDQTETRGTKHEDGHGTVLEPIKTQPEHLSPEEVAALEIRKINTSDEGVEYPTGTKMGLISLALSLSVFLMALVCENFEGWRYDILAGADKVVYRTTPS